MHFYETKNIFFVSKTKQIYAKILTAAKSAFKIKAMLPWVLVYRKTWLGNTMIIAIIKQIC